MSRTGLLIIISTGLLFCMACTKEYQGDTYLQVAMQTVDEHPKEALTVLAEITHPEFLDQDNYMRYLVTLAQARYMNDQDITGDSLILEAQRYFVKKQDAGMATRASYYAAAHWQGKEVKEKELEYVLLAHYFACQAENDLFRAKSLHWIGSIYFNQEVLDSARVYYQQALELYNTKVDAEQSRLDVMYMLARTYFKLQQFEQALNNLDNGLEASRKLNNQLYEIRFAHYIGVVLEEKKDYTKAKEYLNLALSKKPDIEDSLRIYISYARLYRTEGIPDSTKYYLDRVKNRVEELTYPYNRMIAYRELAHYYEKVADIPELKRYLLLVNKEEQKIKELQSQEKIQLANKRFEAYKRNTEQKYDKTWKISLAVTIVLLFLLIVYRFDKRKLKEKYKKLSQRYFSQVKEQEDFLVSGLQRVADSFEELRQAGQGYSDPSARKQIKKFREVFSKQLAGIVRNLLERTPKGVKALAGLTTEDLCIINLVRMNYSDEEIMMILGYDCDMEYYIRYRKFHIRNMLSFAGLKEREIKRVFLQ